VQPANEGREELDAIVVNIELTLVSIIQGVALFFLTDNARNIVTMWHSSASLYVVAGLCVIFIFWSRCVIHSLTLIRWPLEFGHNFFYIACALGESILFSRLDNPLSWFQLSAAYSSVVWFLFLYDMRLIHARLTESRTESERALYVRLRSDQLLNIRLLVPALVFLNVACAVFIWRWPGFFMGRGGNTWLITIQLVSFIGYLIYTGRYFSAIAPLVLRSRRTN
jgi:hypothetical protein